MDFARVCFIVVSTTSLPGDLAGYSRKDSALVAGLVRAIAGLHTLLSPRFLSNYRPHWPITAVRRAPALKRSAASSRWPPPAASPSQTRYPLGRSDTPSAPQF